MTPKKRLGKGGAAGAALDETTWTLLEEARQGPAPLETWADLLGEVPDGALIEVGARIGRVGGAEWLLKLAELIDPRFLMVALAGLGECASPAAATRLAELAEAPTLAKDLHRLARRSLHHLRSRGIATPTPNVPHAAGAAPARYQAVLGLLSAVDLTGARAIRLAVEQPGSEVIFVTAILDPERGLSRCQIGAATRRSVRESNARVLAEDPDEWVEAPGEYALFRLREAVAQSRTSGQPIPNDYHFYAAQLDRVPVSYNRALIYERLEPSDLIAAIPTRDRLEKLLDAFPISTWALGETKLQGLAEEAKSLRQSRIVLSPTAQQERLEQIRRRAWEIALDEASVAHLKRSLEETAYYFLARDQRELAVAAVQAALALAPESGINVRRHPLALALVDRGLGWQPADLPPPDVDPTTGYRRLGGAVLLE